MYIPLFYSNISFWLERYLLYEPISLNDFTNSAAENLSTISPIIATDFTDSAVEN